MFFLEKHRGENAGDGGSFARKLQRFLGAGAWPDAADDDDDAKNDDVDKDDNGDDVPGCQYNTA